MALLSLLPLHGNAQAPAPVRPDQPTASPLQDRLVALEVTVNGSRQGTWSFVERQGELYVGQDAFEEWRLLLTPGIEPISVRGQAYWPLSKVPGFALKLNAATQSAELMFSPDAFFSTRLSTSLTLPKPDPVLPSTFLNYDLSLQSTRTSGRGTEHDAGVLLEGGISTGWGVLTSSHAGRNLTHRDDPSAGWVRLETTLTRQFPEQALTLKAGDSSTRPGLWGSSVYFAGLQLGTDYSLQPGFLTQPIPLFGGVSAAPSTVQLYVNDVLRKVTDVPTGPFVVDNLGGVGGAGEARLVVRDVLGREVVIVQRFFTSAQLLAAGLSDWSVELGAVREDLGLRNAAYGKAFGSGTWRRGLTDTMTVEARGEAMAGGSTSGLGLIAGLPGDVLGRAALAASNHEGIGNGHRLVLGAERIWPAASVFVQAQTADRTYRELGRSGLSSRAEWTANASFDLGFGMRAGLGVTTVRPYDAPVTRTATASLQVPLAGRSVLVLSYSRASGSASGSFLGASLTVPLDSARSLQAAATSHRGQVDHYTSVSQTSTGDTDFGWRALAGRLQQKDHAEAGLFYGGRYGRVYSDISTFPDSTTLRTGATGGLIWAANHLFATRRIDQSFAVVEMKDQAGIGVGLGNNVATETDAGGVALIPNLSAYQTNQVRLNAQDIPLSVELESLERPVVPSWRSGVKVDFAVRAGRAALLRIHLDDGEPAPAGAVVSIQGDKEEFYVARRGEAYVTGLLPESIVSLTWQQRSCRIAVDLPAVAANDEIPRVGPLRCAGVPR